jgi:pilus assembly protein CpaB
MSPTPKKPFKLSIGQLFIVLGVLSALLTFILFKAVFQSKPADEAQQVQKVSTETLIVANRYLMPGEVIQSSDVRETQWPKEYYPSEAVFTQEDDIVGKAVKVDVFPGQPIYRLNLTGTKSKGGLPLLIPRGMRAITIAISEVKGVAGLIKPGDRVDVIGNFTYPVNMAGGDKGNMQDASLSQTILQNIQVLAVSQSIDQVDAQTASGVDESFSKTGGPSKVSDPNASAEKEKPPAKVEMDTSALDAKVATSVTLAVTPDQAQVVSLAEFKGDIKLVLRAEEDETEEVVLGTSEGDMLLDPSVFQKALDFLSLRNVFSSGDSGPAPMSGGAPSMPMSGGGQSAAASYSPPMTPSSNEKHVQVIEGTQVSDVYVPKKR